MRTETLQNDLGTNRLNHPGGGLRVGGGGRRRGTVAAWHRPYLGPVPRPLARAELNVVAWPSRDACVMAFVLGMMAALWCGVAVAQLCDTPGCDPMPGLVLELWLPSVSR